MNSEEKKSTGKSTIIVILIAVAIIGAIAAFFIVTNTQKKAPAKTVKAYLEDVKTMNFDGMGEKLQSADMSALDGTYVTDATLHDFFMDLNGKMTYKIKRINTNLSDGTSSVTATVNFIDGTSIFREAAADLGQQMYNSTFGDSSGTASGTTEEALAQLLMEKAASVEDTFTAMDITYSLVKTDKDWKIMTLDDNTVKVLSCNILESLQQAQDSGSDGAAGENGTQVIQDDKLVLNSDTFNIQYTGHNTDTDVSGNPCLMFYYNYANIGDTTSGAYMDVTIMAYQDGEQLEAALPNLNDPAYDNYYASVQPGASLSVCQAFVLKNTTSDVTITAEGSYDFSGGSVRQILKLIP